MTKFTLTMLDTTGIQPYVFGSNRLQENIGASELVYRATTMWAFEALHDEELRHNVHMWDTLDWKILDDQDIEQNDALDVEVVYAGGGNTFLIFRYESQSREFAQRLTRQVLKDAPGLTVVAQHISIDWKTERLDQKRDTLIQALANHKQSRLPSTPILGLGVTAACASTGLAAARSNEGEIEIDGETIPLKLGDEETRLVSRETAAKLGWRDFANDRLEFHLGKHTRRDFSFPSDVDKLGRVEGEESYVAVVHADGNRMGKHAQKVGKDINWFDMRQGNRNYVQALRKFSRNVNEASLAALQTVVQRLDAAIEWNNGKKRYLVSETTPLTENRWFPFRPLVFGGDDVTFLCNGQLGVSLAVAYLEAFEHETQKPGRELPVMYASAGVAMVKMHYPFARAYSLSEKLAGNAKKFVRQKIKTRYPDENDFSALDWHFATSGLSGSLGEIRRREYLSNDGKPLYLRPLRLRRWEKDQDGRYWDDGMERVLLEFHDDKKWAEHRTKVRGLMEPLRAGKSAAQAYCRNYELPPLPALLPGDTDHQYTGWGSIRCVHFDAIELMDHYVPLPILEV